VGPYRLLIFAESSFPSEELIEAESDNDENLTIYSSFPIENILTHSSPVVTIQEPLTWVDEVSVF
jgi:hypothetical protein